MIAAEAARPDGIEAVAIVTPNHLHAPAALACLKAGLHVICDKPLTTTLAQALELRAAARASDRIFAVTYNYSGYPLVRHARAMIAAGELGEIRLVQVQYAQDWLTEPLEATGQKQAAWRTDPARSGEGGCIGDIGTHAFQLAHFVTGVQPQSLLADLSTFVPGRRVDDNAQILLRYENGARGALWASQVAPGNENNLALRVYGAKGGIEWRQEHPNQLAWTPFGEPTRMVTRGSGAGERSRRAGHAHSGRPSGRLSRGLRDDLFGSRGGDHARRSGAACDARHVSGDRRRRRGRRVHRGGDPVEPRRRRMDAALIDSNSSCA